MSISFQLCMVLAFLLQDDVLMKLCLIQIFVTVIASLGLQSRDDDNVNALCIFLTVWLVLTPCAAPFLHLLSEMDVSVASKMASTVRASSKRLRMSGALKVAVVEDGVEAEPPAQA